MGAIIVDENKFIIETMKEVLEEARETRGCVQQLDKKMDLHIQKTELEFEHIRELDAKQNLLLEEHSTRSDRLEKDNKLREEAIRLEFGERFEDIEAPRKWLTTTLKVGFWVASGAGAIYGLYEFYEFVSALLLTK